WFADNPDSATVQTFARAKSPGDIIPSAFEEMASASDAAIVLATPDDVGQLKGSPTTSDRARQNVWVELGWFWARLGRTRTLLVVKGDVDIPSDYRGVLYETFEDVIHPKSNILADFVARMR